MNKQLKDYIHFYIGCKVQNFSNMRGILRGVELPDTAIIEHIINGLSAGRAIWNIEAVKPILRRLKDMQAIEIQEVELLVMYDTGPTLVTGGDVLEMLSPDSGISFRCDFPTYVSITNWLRKNKFDCDGLIDAGLAIDAATLNK